MRAYCDHCNYPLFTCVCSALEPLSIPLNLYILQHSKEASHAKNTAKLIALTNQRTKIIANDDLHSINALMQRLLPTNSAILYPSDNSEALEDHQHTLSTRLKNLVVIDGSWRQAFGIMQQHTWLNTLPSFHFNHAPKSKYAIRHTKMEAGLSTLEATAYALECIYGIDSSPLYKLQSAMQSHWRGPIHHRRSLAKD